MARRAAHRNREVKLFKRQIQEKSRNGLLSKRRPEWPGWLHKRRSKRESTEIVLAGIKQRAVRGKFRVILTLANSHTG